MSAQTDREDFFVQFTAEAMSIGQTRSCYQFGKDIREILKLTRAQHREAEIACERELTPAELRRGTKQRGRLLELVRYDYGFDIEFSGDPRGAVVKITFPSKRGNCFGDPSLYCVPTR